MACNQNLMSAERVSEASSFRRSWTTEKNAMLKTPREMVSAIPFSNARTKRAYKDGQHTWLSVFFTWIKAAAD